MVADVRFKVRMRLGALMETMGRELDGSQEARKVMALAQFHGDVAIFVRAGYRARVVREFPGCTITFSPNRIYITLPNRYPAHNVPVSMAYPRSLRGGFFPRGFNQPPE